MKNGMLHITGIRKKLIVYYFITIFLLSMTSFFSFYNVRVMLTRIDTVIVDYTYLNTLNNSVNNLMTEVEKYLTTKSSDDLLSYYMYYNELQEKSNNISREVVYDIDALVLKDIGYMIESLLQETDRAVQAKRGRISSEYIAHFTRANQISENIKFYINNLLYSKLYKGSEKYNAIMTRMNYISILNIVIIITAVVANLFLALIFTYRLTKPIIDLARSANRVSQGDFEIELVNINTGDEISVLARAFNKMVISIKSYIDEIKRQAEVDNRLKEQEMQNLRIKSLLREAQLKSLQSQINPHFLFNTLNAASQLSMLEGAEKTSEFIENMADLFRYNLRKIDEPATIGDEVKYVRNYMYILKTRFGSRIEFFTDIDYRALEVKIPCAVIQPIVENAYIHGLQNLEKDGVIYLNVRVEKEQILIEVEDNGSGMDQDRIQDILSADYKDRIKGHVSGIGLYNVIERLQLFYNINHVSDIIEIFSRPGRGTKVTLKIPLEKEENKNHENPHSGR